jgi:hypothetical protein
MGSMTAYENLLPELKTIVDEALSQGFRVFVPKEPIHGPTIHIARVCLDFESSFAEVATLRLLGYEPMLSVPTGPLKNPEWGDREGVEHEHGLPGVMEALRTACLSSTVTKKWDGRTFPNHGKACLKPKYNHGKDGRNGYVEVLPGGGEAPVEL